MITSIVALMMFSLISSCKSLRISSILQRSKLATSSMPPKLATVVLKQNHANMFRAGNPIVYDGAVHYVIGQPDDGDYVQVEDSERKLVGRGLFNSRSSYRVRLLVKQSDGDANAPFDEVVVSRIHNAIDLRSSICLPSSLSTAFRAINGEGDGLSGLNVDVLGPSVVVQSSAIWVEKNQGLITSALSSHPVLSKKDILWRQVKARLSQDTGGLFKADAASDISENSESVELSEKPPVTILENGVLYDVRPGEGQKTGFYCDQRNNRKLIRELSYGKSVLDLYCFSGGFALNAAIGGARRVVGVDSSLPAIEMAEANAKKNSVHGVVEFIQSEAVAFMEKARESGELFDVVICDPPKLAPSKSSLKKAGKKYSAINAMAMSLVAPGGLLFTCTCSQAVAQSEGEFLRIIREAGRSAGRDVTVLGTYGAGEDHPVHISYLEGKYFLSYLLRVR